ncbi:MAG: polyprenyl synthetase family protein [Proteobacteria bacterium]|nr:polyprenyl synthetase family protein [Pseudomonadota bacterium]
MTRVYSCYQKRVNNFLNNSLNLIASQSSTLNDAIAYSLLNGGKRIRPLLSYYVAETIHAELNATDYIAASIEMIHAYSLIHDDLPAMDDDNLRRGQSTCHIKFDEATAILAGDALQAMAFEVLSKIPIKADIAIKLIARLAVACGQNGMAGGQSLDLEAENKSITLDQLEGIHQAKTGALLSVCVTMTTELSDVISASDKKQFSVFGDNFGIAFQIIDDILDVTTDTKTLGKPAGSDATNKKSTYPNLLGLKQAKLKAQNHIKLAKQALDQTSFDTTNLQSLANLILNRSF